VTETVGHNNRKRILWIDLFRGFVLIVVLIDHVELLNDVHCLATWTPQSLGFADAAEGFVFLSGYSFALTSKRRLAHRGLLRTLLYATKKSLQIYLAYLMTVAAALTFGLAFKGFSPSLMEHLHLTSPLPEQFLGALKLSNHPYGFAILPFYVLALPYGTLIAYLLRRQAALALSITFGLYLAAYFIPNFNFSATYQEDWFFNPFSWQFLFALGILSSTYGSRIPRKIHLPLTTLSAAVVVAGILYHKVPFAWTAITGLTFDSLSEVLEPYLAKTTLSPLRLLHFMSVAWLLSTLVKSDSGLTHWTCQWVVHIGQRSLFFYSASLLLSFMSVLAIQACGTSTLSVILIHIDLLAIAYFLSIGWKKVDGSEQAETVT